MKVLITGKTGQLGIALQKVVQEIQTTNDYLFFGRETFDLSKINHINEWLNQQTPDLIINAAAYTQVDQAEKEPEKATTINHWAVNEIAKWCTQHHCKLIHFSTDYVFDGTKKTPYVEEDSKNPLNVYGKTKSEGERSILSQQTDAMIFRVSWLYGEEGTNFVNTMLRLMKERKTLSIVNDQIGAPTYTGTLAKNIIEMVERGQWEKGIFHYHDIGMISWYDFALKIKELIGSSCEIHPIKSNEYPTLATRPLQTILATDQVEKNLHWKLNPWEVNLQNCLQNLKKK